MVFVNSHKISEYNVLTKYLLNIFDHIFSDLNLNNIFSNTNLRVSLPSIQKS